MNNDLLLLSGADIPFVEGTVTIHQPTLREISLIGETAFFAGCELLRFSKDILNDEDKIRLNDWSDFHIIMSIMNDKSGSMAYNASCAKQVLILMFPQYNITFHPDGIMSFSDMEGNICGSLNSVNFPVFKEILLQMFCLGAASAEPEYNAKGELAKKIAEKLKKRKKQLAELSSKTQKVTIFSRYISILTVGEHKDMNSFMQYTIYQLFDEFQRFQLKMNYDVYFQARMAGAKDLQQPEDWMKNIHEDGQKT